MTEQTVQKPWVYEEDGLIVYRANSLFSCIRSMVACRTGETPSGPAPWLRTAFEASSGLEESLLRQTAEHLSGNLLWHQRRFDLALYDNVIVRCHIDAMHQISDTIIEAKALGDVLWEQYIDGGLDAMGKLGEKYKWQGAVQGYATGRKVRFAVGHKVKRDDGEWYLSEVRVSHPYSPEELVPREDIEAHVRRIEECAAADELPPCDFDCKPGDAFDEVHIFPSAEKGDADLESLLLRYDELDDRIKDLTDEKGELRDALIENYGFQKYAAGVCSMNIIRVKGTRFDTKWLKKHMPDVYDQGVVPTETIRVDVDGPRKRARKKPKQSSEGPE